MEAAGLPGRASSTKSDREPESVAGLYKRWCAYQTNKKAASTLRRYGPSLESLDRFWKGKDWRLIGGDEIFDWANLAQGLFATPATYPAAMRISTIPGDLLDDNVSVPRGLALKIIGVPGERLDGSEDETTQDFIMVNGPVLGAPTGKAFLQKLKLLAGTNNKAEGAKKVLSTVLQSVESLVEAFGGKSATLIQMGGHPETSPLGETYFTQAPLLHGEYVAKYALFPVSPELTAMTDAKVDVSGKPDGLRQAAIDFFHAHGGVWELRAQLCTDLETMPVEDSNVQWPEDKSPYVTVARVSVKPQVAWSEAKSRAFDDGLSFSPWHGLKAHRPLGSINRLRKPAYRMSARFRFERNGCPVMEPKTREDIAG